MNGGPAAKIRLVRCPNCRNVLVEPKDIPVYTCGGCSTYLRAKIRKSNPEVATSGLHETDELCSPSVNNDVIVNDAQNVVGVRTEQNTEVDNVPVVETMAHAQAGEDEELLMEGVPPSSMDDDVNQLDLQAQEDNFNMSELPSYEAKFIKKVVKDVACKLGNKTLHVAKHPGGISSKNMVRGRTEPVEEHDVENSGRLLQPGAGATSFRILEDNPSETRGAPLLSGSTRLVGQAFEENKNVIWSLLMDDEVSTIGIYGMGEPVKLQC